jgi:hypothetical protein
VTDRRPTIFEGLEEGPHSVARARGDQPAEPDAVAGLVEALTEVALLPLWWLRAA